MKVIPEKPIEATLEAIQKLRDEGRRPIGVRMTKEFALACRQQVDRDGPYLAVLADLTKIAGLPITVGELPYGEKCTIDCEAVDPPT